MNAYEIFFGEMSSVLSNTIVLVILVLMSIISLRLYFDRRKKAYFSMTVSLLILGFYYLLQLILETNGIQTSTTTYVSLMLKIISFVLVNMGIYQLYNPTRRKQYLFFYGLIAIGFILSILHVYIPRWYTGPADQVLLLQDIGLELYMFVLIFIFFYMIPPFIGQHFKYQMALTVYFLERIAHIINMYMFENKGPVFTLAGHLLPILYFLLLFLLLFERVVELLQAIYNSSITDGLTRLYNRKFFYGRVNQYVQRHLPVAVMFSDIDNFKKLNDTKGHHMGDKVLKQVAEILKEECEDCGIAGRYGGEEMVILVTDPSVKMDVFTERVRKRIEEETIVTASLGYSQYKNGLTADELIKQADEAMYKAKTTGKNKVVAYG